MTKKIEVEFTPEQAATIYSLLYSLGGSTDISARGFADEVRLKLEGEFTETQRIALERLTILNAHKYFADGTKGAIRGIMFEPKSEIMVDGYYYVLAPNQF
jgi:hypothetical protein